MNFDEKELLDWLYLLRKTIFDAYEKESKTEDGIYGKSSEGYCEIYYPTWWECKSIEEFSKPKGIMVCSYALGTSRSHYFNYGDKYKEINYYTWESPNPFETAIEVIKSWSKER